MKLSHGIVDSWKIKTIEVCLMNYDKNEKKVLLRFAVAGESTDLTGTQVFPLCILLVQIVIQTQKVALNPEKIYLEKSAWRWYVR